MKQKWPKDDVPKAVCQISIYKPKVELTFKRTESHPL